MPVIKENLGLGVGGFGNEQLVEFNESSPFRMGTRVIKGFRFLLNSARAYPFTS
jgi:hypothetical protein